MSKCRVTRKNTHCGPVTIQEPSAVSCGGLEVCLSFGRTLVWDGNCFVVRGTPQIEDGWYGAVQVVNGCIVDARAAPSPTYTPAPCAPSTEPCGEGGGGSSVTLNPAACNLLEYVSGMLQAKIFFGDHDGITVEGCGTQGSPLRFIVEQEGSGSIVQSGTPSVLTLEGDGSIKTPYTLSLATGPLQAGMYGPYEIDEYGRVVSYDKDREGVISGITDGDGVKLDITGGLLSAELMDVQVTAGQYTTGGYTYTVNKKGQVTGIRRDIEIDEETYQLGAFNVSVNAYGSITGIQPVNVDNVAIPDTFVASFRGSSASEDIDRSMTITTEMDGPLHVEYRGLLGRTALDPGMTMTLPAGFGITVDDISLADPLIEVAGVFTDDGVGGNAIVAIRATSMNAIAAGQHTIAITAPTAIITQRDGFMRAQIVGRGA